MLIRTPLILLGLGSGFPDIRLKLENSGTSVLLDCQVFAFSFF
jgi:hypothetical protein